MAVSGGGLSKGGSPIWPGGKPSGEPIKPAEQVEQSFQLHKGVSTPGTKAATGATQVESTSTQAAQAAETAQPVTQIKSLSVQDILQQLANIKVPVNDHNQELALLMAAHGIEISEDSFALINKLLKGKKSQSAKESAVMLLSKGLGEQVDNVDVINQFLNKQASVSRSLNNLLQMQGKMQDILNSGLKNNPGLQAFMSVFEEFNDQLKQLKKISRANRLLGNQSALMDDLVAMEAFLKGLNQSVLDSKGIKKYLKELHQLNQNLLGQLILSQDSVKQPLGMLESYHYFQIPNPLSAQAVIEMLLRKQARSAGEKNKGKKKTSKDREKIIISMETESMGTLTITIVVMGFRVWCTVYSDQEEAVNHAASFRQELVENLKKHDYDLEEFKSVRKKVDIKKFMAPSQDFTNVKRIQTEI
jgi:hypothetical protein